MRSFDLRPFEGAAPILFGMSRKDVIEILGSAGSSGRTFEGAEYDTWGPGSEINVGYATDGTVDHVGLSPGPFELHLQGTLIWNPNSDIDPNPFLLELDPEPVECDGFLLFTKLGIGTTGYHDDEPSEWALSIAPKGGFDEYLDEAEKPNLSKYKRRSKPKRPRKSR